MPDQAVQAEIQTPEEGPANATDDNLKQAEAALGVATAVLKERQVALDTLTANLAQSREEFARLEALEELTQKEVLAEHNTRRKVRRLEGDLQHSMDLVDAAKAAVETADQEVAVWRLAVLDAELAAMDADFLADARETATRFAEKRAAIFAKLRQAHELNFRLRPGADWTHRGALAGIPWENAPPLEAVQETLVRVAAIERQQQLDSPGDYVRSPGA